MDVLWSHGPAPLDVTDNFGPIGSVACWRGAEQYYIFSTVELYSLMTTISAGDSMPNYLQCRFLSCRREYAPLVSDKIYSWNMKVCGLKGQDKRESPGPCSPLTRGF